MGHAGSGKSTICRLLNDHFPCFADDAVWLLHQQDHTWHVVNGDNRVFAGPPKAGEFSRIQSIPLCAILRLRQDTTVSLSPLVPSETCRHLIDALFEIVWQKYRGRPIIRELFRSVAQIARTYEGWLLHFARDQSPFDLLNRQFGQ